MYRAIFNTISAVFWPIYETDKKAVAINITLFNPNIISRETGKKNGREVGTLFVLQVSLLPRLSPPNLLKRSCCSSHGGGCTQTSTFLQHWTVTHSSFKHGHTHLLYIYLCVRIYPLLRLAAGSREQDTQWMTGHYAVTLALLPL